MAQALPRAYDLIVYGASGFTGRLVTEHLLGTYGATGEIKWAMAGRSTGKLAEVRDLIGGPSNLPLIAADASDPASLKTMAESAKVIISTVGPYQLYGEGLVAAYAAAGTDYVDLCGEPAWMAAMIRKYGDAAQASGAHRVFVWLRLHSFRSGSLLSRAAGAGKVRGARDAGARAGAENERLIFRRHCGKPARDRRSRRARACDAERPSRAETRSSRTSRRARGLRPS
jgi:hypothetical protein